MRPSIRRSHRFFAIAIEEMMAMTKLEMPAAPRAFALVIALASLTGVALSDPSPAQDAGSPALSEPAPPALPAVASPPAVPDSAPSAAPASPASPAMSDAAPPPSAAALASQPQPDTVAPPPPAPALEPSAAAAPAAPPNTLIGIDSSELPRNLSPWGMFQAADIVVKAVMIGLALASFATWTVWLAKSLELAVAKRRLRRASRAINGAISLAEAAQRLGTRRSIVRGYIDQARLELDLSTDISDKAGISARVASRVSGLATAAGRAMNRGTGILATIGSTAPFVGLFGTVWGIMNSFINISEAQTTNLAVVAPGIAEALLATAFGLVAAIPAVIIYNGFSRSISAYKAALTDAADEVMRIVTRDLDRGVRAPLAEAAE